MRAPHQLRRRPDEQTLKREQARINAEVAEAESQLATDGEKLKQATKIIDLALDPAKNCAVTDGSRTLPLTQSRDSVLFLGVGDHQLDSGSRLRGIPDLPRRNLT